LFGRSELLRLSATGGAGAPGAK